jgi:hypothetical protein
MFARGARGRSLEVIFLGGLLLAGGLAEAEALSPPPIPISSAAILELRFVDVPPALAEQLRQKLRHAFNLEGYKVLDEAGVRRQLRDVVPPGCMVGPCLARVARALQVERALVGGVRGQGSSYDYTLTLLETGGGSLLAQVNARCDVCSFKELEDSIGRAASQLHKQSLGYLATRSLLRVQSSPPGAEILLDDLLIGRTPLSHVVTPGVHTIEVAVRGRAGVKQKVSLAAGKTRLLHVDLQRFTPVAGAGPGVRRRIPRWLKWATLGAGVALAGTGAGLWAIDGREKTDPRFLHDTRDAGIALVSVGASALASSALLYFFEGPDASELARRRASPQFASTLAGGQRGR